MNRAVICGIIFSLIIISAVLSVVLLGRSTEHIYELIDRVTAAYESGDMQKTESEITELEQSWESCCKRLSFLVPSEQLVEISYDIARLRDLCKNGSEDLLAECKGIRRRAELVCESQMPRLHSVF